MRCAIPLVTLLIVSLTCPLGVAQSVDETPIPVRLVRAFPQLKIRRPTVITHAGDGTNRLFVVTQQGQISVFPNDQEVQQASIFLDIEKKVVYKDRENEEGMLGLAFHPKYKENGQFFVYYTTADAPHTSVLSRFHVSKSDPNQADPASEEELMRIPQPFWNHNGGSIQFGPDGYLYIGLGDGGAANDPFKNGQKLSTVLGKILRIDIDRKSDGKAYAIPKDNPFVGQKDAAPEIFAYGFRNPWGLHFDPKTGQLWVADVGQDLWEEIDLVVKGGNYGWNLREGMHKFGPQGSEPRPDLIDPIWEYHHSVGKSITGGAVYRGSRLPELTGHYLYCDYVSGKVWALKYDEKTKKVTANHTIESETMPFINVGQDSQGEVYFTDSFGQIWWPERSQTVLFKENFESGVALWEPKDPAQWQHKALGKEQHVFSQFEKKSSYKPPHRSPTNIALLKDLSVADFELTARVKSTHPDYGHRDAVLVFGYQDPAHFYYVHLGKQADDHANQIFIVNDAPRTKISLTSTPGTNWTDDWHNVKIVRKVSPGTIEIYFDDMQKPVMTAKDTTFAWGRIGIGTFDDTSEWDDIELRGVKKEPK